MWRKNRSLARLLSHRRVLEPGSLWFEAQLQPCLSPLPWALPTPPPPSAPDPLPPSGTASVHSLPHHLQADVAHSLSPPPAAQRISLSGGKRSAASVCRKGGDGPGMPCWRGRPSCPPNAVEAEEELKAGVGKIRLACCISQAACWRAASASQRAEALRSLRSGMQFGCAGLQPVLSLSSYHGSLASEEADYPVSSFFPFLLLRSLFPPPSDSLSSCLPLCFLQTRSHGFQTLPSSGVPSCLCS